MALFAAVLGGSALLGAGAQIFGAQAGASAQRDAANAAIQAQLQIYGQNKQNLQPFINVGQAGGNALQSALPTLTTPFGAPAGSGATGTVDAAGLQRFLESTPGYQFTRQQGLNATTNNFSAQGLAGGSGAQGKGLVNYAEGLAGTTFQQQLDNYLRTNMQNYNILQGTTNTGVQAGGALAGVGTQVGQGIASNITGAGAATAGADVASGNAFANALQGGANNYISASLLQRLMQGQGGGGGGAGAGVISPELQANSWAGGWPTAG